MNSCVHIIQYTYILNTRNVCIRTNYKQILIQLCVVFICLLLCLCLYRTVKTNLPLGR